MKNQSLASFLLAASLGCSVMVDASREQCSTNLDCRVRGLEFEQAFCIDNLCQVDPTWACIDSGTPPATQAAMSASLQVIRFTDGMPVAGARATLYAPLDFALESPLDEAETDAEGRATLRVPAGFEGLVFLQADGVMDPTIVYPTWPVSAEAGLGLVAVGQPGATNNLAGLIGAIPQSGRGIALLNVQDCTATGGNGASVVYEGETQGSTPFYALNGVASSSARALDRTGLAGIVNVRPGVVGIEVRSGDQAVSSASVIIRADTVTQVTMLPGRSSQGFSAATQ